PESQKQNRIDISEKKPQVNNFYLVISGRFKTAKYITLCVLVIFLLTMVVLCRDEITVENLRYLFKDFEMGENVVVNTDSSITYDSDPQVNLALYKGDLVISGSTNFTLCDLQGNNRLSEDSLFSNPVILTGDKYILVYGLSENTYAMYNTFSKLHTESFDYPIIAAALSDEGMYAIVTRTTEYRSVIYIYNKNFERVGAIYKDKYIVDIEFNSDGTKLLIASTYSSNGNYCTELVNYTPYSNEASKTQIIENSMPIKVAYNKNGGYSIACDNCIYFYDSEYNHKSTFDFGTKILPLSIEMTNEHTTITYSENIVGEDIRVLVFDENGSTVVNASASGIAKKTRTTKDYVYVLQNGSVCRINNQDGSAVYYNTEKNAHEMLLVNDSLIVVGFTDHVSKLTIQ
ncbi:MAG: hypothetical protein IKL40_02075, partial [Clostridia bacterium]|nr:hypothetical protein [Clostridia bacterium]